MSSAYSAFQLCRIINCEHKSPSKPRKMFFKLFSKFYSWRQTICYNVLLVLCKSTCMRLFRLELKQYVFCIRQSKHGQTDSAGIPSILINTSVEVIRIGGYVRSFSIIRVMYSNYLIHKKPLHWRSTHAHCLKLSVWRLVLLTVLTFKLTNLSSHFT